MARVYSVQKCRKAQKCSKCGKPIEVGQPYKYAEPYHGPKIIRCVECGLKGWETSSSEFVHTVAPICEDWETTYGTDFSAIQSDLEDLRDQCEENLDNIPEQLQDGSAGQLLQERIEMLEDVINELDSIDEDTIREDIEGEYLSEFLLDHELDETLDEVPGDYKSEWNEDIEAKVHDGLLEAIEEALQNLEY